MEKDKTAFLKLMMDSTEKISRYIGNMGFDDFNNDDKTVSAVFMQLQTIGELAKKVPDEIKSEIDVPWKKVTGLRDMISHDYFNLDTDAIWQTVQKDVVELKGKLQNLLLPQVLTSQVLIMTSK